jgi:hypothetical protein
MESLRHPALGFAELCRIIQSALEPIGFCGISISLPQADWMDETLLLPLRRNGAGGYSYLWRKEFRPQWELRLELNSSSGSKLGDLHLFRELASDPLLVDLNLVDHEFRAAVSALVEQAVSRMPVTTESLQKGQDRLAKVMEAGS